MNHEENEIKASLLENPELIHYILDESSLYALLDTNYNILWMREEAGAGLGTNFPDHFELKLKNGKYYSSNDGKCFIIEDIPGQNYRFVKLEKAHLSDDIRGIAHDFNNIFSSILNQLDHLKDKLNDQKDNFKALDSIEKQAMRATEILESALNKKDSKKLKQKIKPELLFDEILESLQKELPQNHKIIKQIEYNYPLLIARSELYRCMLNIVKNAIEASDKIQLVLKFSTLFQNNKVLISIEDNGQGISPEKIDRIFDHGYSTKQKVVDSGIGLAVTKKILEEAGGEIIVESEPGAGTKFTISLPAQRKNRPKKRDEKKTILIADDEADMRELLGELFSDFNYEVIQADNGLEALLKYEKNNSIDLLIVDKKMPVSDGFEFIAQVRKSDDETPVILASGSLKDSEKREILRLNINRILEKPYKFEELLKLTEELINT
ncbi:MAG: hypothetical protein SCALA702_18700 [Melioribacteraceae bacterium]|nr:MAG: hypothetical protein SCALA702_18700 [Melioribacteraceae bacterium]